MERILDEIVGEEKGPLVILIAGIHGNEIVGILAAEDIFRKIRQHNIKINGRLIAIAGNIQAIEANKRYIHYDLNRAWREEHIFDIRHQEEINFAEDRELKELMELLDNLIGHDAHPEKIIVDLHATSSEKGNFIIIPESESEHPVVQALHLPVVIDLEQFLEGTLLNYYQHRDVISFAFEGGLIGSREAVELHESGIWEILDAAKMISRHDHHDVDHYENKLKRISSLLPGKVKAFHRHWVEKDDEFVMKPGFTNFDPIEKGQLVARDRNGPIYAPASGLIFMPLYQQDGNDGYFIVEEISSKQAVNLAD